MRITLEEIPGWGEHLVSDEREELLSAVDARYAADSLRAAIDVFGPEGGAALAALAPDVFNRAVREILGE